MNKLYTLVMLFLIGNNIHLAASSQLAKEVDSDYSKLSTYAQILVKNSVGMDYSELVDLESLESLRDKFTEARSYIIKNNLKLLQEFLKNLPDSCPLKTFKAEIEDSLTYKEDPANRYINFARLVHLVKLLKDRSDSLIYTKVSTAYLRKTSSDYIRKIFSDSGIRESGVLIQHLENIKLIDPKSTNAPKKNQVHVDTPSSANSTNLPKMEPQQNNKSYKQNENYSENNKWNYGKTTYRHWENLTKYSPEQIQELANAAFSMDYSNLVHMELEPNYQIYMQDLYYYLIKTHIHTLKDFTDSIPPRFYHHTNPFEGKDNIRNFTKEIEQCYNSISSKQSIKEKYFYVPPLKLIVLIKLLQGKGADYGDYEGHAIDASISRLTDAEMIGREPIEQNSYRNDFYGFMAAYIATKREEKEIERAKVENNLLFRILPIALKNMILGYLHANNIVSHAIL